ncbi:hypothetical protein ACFL6K_04795 [Candidatus Latescibacterota bacterium]
MQHLKHIRIVARTEAKIFSRSWIFRFFVVFTFIILGILNVSIFSHTNSNWVLRCISSSPAYLNFLILALIQSLIVPFGAIDSLRSEIKLDIFESLHARSFKNPNHIIGKALGIMVPFLIVNAMVLAGALVYNAVFADDVPVVLQAYILYPFVLSIPTLFFVTSLSFFVVSIIRNQAISLVIVIGYSLFSFAYGVGYAGRLIDFTGFHIPMLYSDFVGVENIREILIHRLLYLSLGIGFLAFSCMMFKRLIQSNVSKRLTMIAVVICFVLSPSFAYVFMLDVNHGINLRTQMNELNNKYVSYPRAKVSGYSLEINHNGRNLNIDAELTLSNPTEKPLDMLILTLNPGFEIKSVTSEGTDLKFERETQIIKVIPDSPLIHGQNTTITVNYSGTVDNNACYIDIDEDSRGVINRLFVFAVDKRYGFVAPEYVLLTPESTWYPISGIPYGMVFPDAQWKDFADFEVSVSTAKGLSVISQADVKDNENGKFSFTTDEKLTGLSLIIGEYEKNSVEVDGVEFAIYVRPGHDYYSPYFTDSENIAKEIILNTKLDYEYEFGMKYPFKRYMLVESPVQFMAYQRPWRTHTESVQPQMAILPEKGAFMRFANIRTRYNYQIATSGGDEKASTENLISNFINYYMEDDKNALDIIKENKQITRTINSIPMLKPLNDIIPSYVPSYTLSAQFYPFINSIESDEYPILNYIMEYYRKYGLNINNQTGRPDALLDEEIICMELGKSSFENILKDSGMNDKLDTLLKIKANQLFISMPSSAGEDDLNKFLNNYIANNKFQSVSFESFSESLNTGIGDDFTGQFDSWYNENRLPEFVISEPIISEILSKERTLYQLTFRIDNISEVSGAVWSKIVESSQYNLYHNRIISLEPRQSKEFGFITDYKPERVGFNTLVSKNIPIKFGVRLNGKLHEDHDAEPFDGERIVEYSPPVIDPNAIIVDNLDPGFEILSQPTEKYSMIRAMDVFGIGLYPEDFVNCMPGRVVPFWAKSVFTKGYGHNNSAYYTSPGNGDGSVSWTATIKKAGSYSLEYYFSDTNSVSNYSGVLNNPLADMPFIGEYNLIIKYSGISNRITYIPSTSGGWQHLDSFELKPGIVTVELSNISTGKLIYADAIRWVKKE